MQQIQTAISFTDPSYSSEKEEAMDSALLALFGVGVFNKILQKMYSCSLSNHGTPRSGNFLFKAISNSGRRSIMSVLLLSRWLVFNSLVTHMYSSLPSSSVGFSRQEYWGEGGVAISFSSYLPNTGIEPMCPVRAGGFFFYHWTSSFTLNIVKPRL